MLLIQNVILEGQLVDIRCADTIVEIGTGLAPGDCQVLDGQAGTVLPGLHDHHIHLYATAQARCSVDLSDVVEDHLSWLAQEIARVPGADWVRAIGYFDQQEQPLTAKVLDQFCANRPLRVQHASGKAWMLNSLAIQQLNLAQVQHAGVERDAQGEPTGVLWRMDDWLRTRLAQTPISLKDLSQQLASSGITSVTDASFTNSAASVLHFAELKARGEFAQDVHVLGDDSVQVGHLKIMLDEDDLPDLEALVGRGITAHKAGRLMAFHCVSHVELVFALAVLQALEQAVGKVPGHRIEHGGVIRSQMLAPLAQSGACVVTQPGFIWAKGDRYRQLAEPQDQPYLYPFASLLAAGVPVVASSDAPYGPLNPWRVMHSAVNRKTRQGVVVATQECISAQQALDGYLAPALDPGGAPRRLTLGAQSDLCILNTPLADALDDLLHVTVFATVIGGELVYESSASIS